MEGGGVLLHCEVDQTQIVQDLPVKWCQVVGPLQTTDGLLGIQYTIVLKSNRRYGTNMNIYSISSSVRRYGATYTFCMNIIFSNKQLTLTATYFFFPKKHMAMLFQSGGDSGMVWAATRYLARATSKSWWLCCGREVVMISVIV